MEDGRVEEWKGGRLEEWKMEGRMEDVWVRFLNLSEPGFAGLTRIRGL